MAMQGRVARDNRPARLVQGISPVDVVQTAPFVDEQHSKPALLFVVRSDSLRGAFRDARIRSEGGVVVL
jgi:hypothetical protein